MKNFKLFKWLLLSVFLSITSINQMWAGWNMWGNIVFDNTNKQWSAVTLVIGREGCSKAFSFMPIDNTNLYYQWVHFDNYDDLYFLGEQWDNDSECNGQTPWTRVSGYSNRWQPLKAWYNESDGGQAKTYYFDGDYKAAIWYNIPYKTATVKVKKSVNGAAYTEITSGQWPAEIELTGTYMKTYPHTSAQSTITTSSGASGSYGSIPISGEVTLSLGDANGSYTTDNATVFEGWGTGSSPTITNTSHMYNLTDNTTYYAFFRSPRYTVKYHANGGTGSMSDQNIYLGVSTALTANSFTKANYTFVGWSTSPTGAKEYDNEESVTDLEDEEGDVVDLYAVWEPQWCIRGIGGWSSNSNTLTYVSGTMHRGKISLAANTTYDFKVYNRNGANDTEAYFGHQTGEGNYTTFSRGGTTSQSGLANNKNNLKISTDIAEEYTFEWNTSGNVLSITFPTPTYDIHYYDQGGSAFTGTQADAPTTHTYATPTNLVIPTREGYNFAGWFTTSDCSTGQVGTTSSATLGATDYTADINLYAKWTDDGKYYYKGESADGWETDENWTKGVAPSSSSANIIALKPLQAPSGTTTVNSVLIATSGIYTPVGGSGITANGSLTIPGSAALKVVTSVANCTISDNEPTSGTSTTPSTLSIGVRGALVWGTSGSPGAASVGFYTSSGGIPGSNEAVNEYIGIPFTSLNSDSYYNAWVFAVSGETWAEVNGATLSPWTGYNIIEKKEKSGETGGSYTLTGTLVSNASSLTGGATAGSETLYANSWVAPIEISKIGYSGTGTIYMFTPSSLKDLEDAGLVGDAKGNYSSITINESAGSYIHSMQSFSVWTGTSISISYATAVYGEVGGAFSAPRRARQTDYRQAIWDTQDSLFVNVTCASGWGDELKMFIHNDFSQNYENGWDGPKMEGMWEAPKLYTLNNEGEMAVSCVPSVDNNVIAFHAGTASNEYTFTFKYSGEDELVLKDTKTGIEIPIVDGGTYEFTSNKGDDDMRFVIKKAPAVVTGVDEISGNNSGVQKFMHNGTMYIVRDGRIYSVEGALVK